jgi:hypothetical protein
MNEIREPLRDQVGRALYEETATVSPDWSSLSEERREPWRKDADRIIPIVQADYSAVLAERNRAQSACEQMGRLDERR